MWSPRRLIVAGALVLAAALALAVAARVLRGALNPDCTGFCAPLVVLALQWLALPLAIYGALLVGMGIARAQPPPENVQEAPPRSPPP